MSTPFSLQRVLWSLAIVASVGVGLAIHSIPVSAEVTTPPALTSAPGRYDMGNPTLQNIWIDPVLGNDENSGATRALAMRTVRAAWQSIPVGTNPRTGYRLLLTRGTYSRAGGPGDNLPNFWDDRMGTAQFPIIVESVDGRGAAVLQGDINSKGLKYFYLINVTIAPVPAGDPLHFELGDHILVRGVTLNGGSRQEGHETLKVNQTKYMYVEDSDISGADDNAIDFVAVQYGHVIGNKIHNSGDWCMYSKGGSANLLISGNEIYDCGTGGYTAGQGVGFQYMTAPWVQYEAYDIKFVNNVIHDTGTAGLGVNGGYNVLLAYNTLYRVGVGHNGHNADHIIEVNPGNRACDGSSDPVERAACQANKTAGGWGTLTSEDQQYIPSRNVFIYNNLVLNPAGASSPNILQIRGPVTPPSGSGLSGQQRVDTNLQIKNNVFADAGAILGIDDSSGCQPSNVDCNEAQLTRDNQINTATPNFVGAAQSDFRLSNGASALFGAIGIPSFPGGDRPASNIPVGDLTNTVATDRSGASRTAGNIVGAYVSGASTPTPTVAPAPVSAPVSTPTPVSNSSTPAPTPRPVSAPVPTPTASPSPVSVPVSSNSVALPLSVVPGPDLTLSLFATPYPTVQQNETVVYQVTIRNQGGALAENVIAVFPTPANTDVVSMSRLNIGGCSTTERSVRCDLDDLASGATLNFIITYRPHAVGPFQVVGDVQSNTTDSVMTNNHAQVSVTVTGTSSPSVPPTVPSLPRPPVAPVAPLLRTPNLTGRWVSAVQTCKRVRGQEQCSFKGRFLVRNVGQRTAAVSRLGMYLSADDRLNAGDVSIKTYAVGSIVAGGSRTIIVSLPRLPRNFHPAYMISLADATRVVAESSESDNVVAVRTP